MINSVDDPGIAWRFFTDAVMGGRSAGHVEHGRDGRIGFVRMVGTVSTANNGGFIQIQARIAQPPAGASGVHITVRGNGEGYFVHLRSLAAPAPTSYWRAPFVAGRDWQDVRLPFAAFTPSRPVLPVAIDPAGIGTLAIVAFGRDMGADVQVATTGFW